MNLVFKILKFWKADHEYTKKFVKNDLLQTIQTITAFSNCSISVQSVRKTRTAIAVVILTYSSKWIVDKRIFRKALDDFWANIEEYKKINQYHNFRLRIENIAISPKFFLSIVFDSSEAFSSDTPDVSRKADSNQDTVRVIFLKYSVKEDQFKIFNQNQLRGTLGESFKSQTKNKEIESKSSNQFIQPGTQIIIRNRAFLNFPKKNSQQTQQFLRRLNIINPMTNSDSVFFNLKFVSAEIFLENLFSLVRKFQNLHFFSFSTISFQENTFVETDSTIFRRVFRDFFSVSKDLFENKKTYHLKSNDVFENISEKDRTNSKKNENTIDQNISFVSEFLKNNFDDFKKFDDKSIFQHSQSSNFQQTSSSKNSMNQLTPQMKAMIDQTIERAVNKILTDGQTGFQKSSRPSKTNETSNSQNFQNSIKNVMTNELNRWNSKNIGFFDLNYEKKSVTTKNVLKHFEKNTYYKNVHVFVERVKEMAIVLNANVIRRNLSSCFRGTAFM